MRALCPRRRTSAPKPLLRDKICTGTAAHSVVCSCCQLRPLVLTWKASSVRIPVVAGSRSRLRPTDERCRANQRRARAVPPRAHFTSKYTRKGERRGRLRARALVLIDQKPGAARASVVLQTGSVHAINQRWYWHANLRVSVSVSGLVYHPDGRPHLDSARSAIERGSMRLRCHLTSSAQCYVYSYFLDPRPLFLFPGGPRFAWARARRRGRRSVGVGVKDLRMRGPADRAACAESKNGILLDSVCLG